MDTTTAIIEALERAPGVVIPLVREVPTDVLKRRPSPGKWSAHEHACHLALVHRLFFDRLDQMLASPPPVITPYDPGTNDPDDLHAYRIEELLLKKEWPTAPRLNQLTSRAPVGRKTLT